MSAVVWVVAGWIAVSLLLALAFALGAGIGYRRGQEDAGRSEDRTIRVDEEQPNLPEQPRAQAGQLGPHPR